MKERSGLIVWLHNTKNIRALRRYGSIYYFSRRLKYVSLYCDLEDRDYIVSRLGKLRFVKRVDLSFLHELKRDYNKNESENHGTHLDQEDFMILQMDL